jgi:hypothetical protein
MTIQNLLHQLSVLLNKKSVRQQPLSIQKKVQLK